jgi:hypothetical protein
MGDRGALRITPGLSRNLLKNEWENGLPDDVLYEYDNKITLSRKKWCVINRRKKVTLPTPRRSILILSNFSCRRWYNNVKSSMLLALRTRRYKRRPKNMTDTSLSRLEIHYYFPKRRLIKSAGLKGQISFFHFSVSHLTDRLAKCWVSTSTFEKSETIKQTLPLKQVKRNIVTSQHYSAKGAKSPRENKEERRSREGGNLLEAFWG